MPGVRNLFPVIEKVVFTEIMEDVRDSNQYNREIIDPEGMSVETFPNSACRATELMLVVMFCLLMTDWKT